VRAQRIEASPGLTRTQLSDGSGSTLVRKKNGELLRPAETEFDVLITVDTNLRYQQNLTARKIAVVLLLARSNRLEILSPYFSACALALETIRPGDFVEVGDVNR
jgi:hypothetical protein